MLPVGKLTVEQMRGLAALARDLGDGDIRLTVWQNLLISGVPTGKLEDAEGRDRGARARLAGDIDPRRACRLHRQHGLPLRGAPTPRDTPRTSRAGARRASTLDSPVNIHLTGCHHSCAQHYIGDIGLIGAKVPRERGRRYVEGYHLVVGGGFGPDAGIGRELSRDIRAEDAPRGGRAAAEDLPGAPRIGPDETFQAFTRRHDIEALAGHSAGELAA